MTEVQIRLVSVEDYLQLFSLVERNRQRLLKYFWKTCSLVADLASARKFVQQKSRLAAAGKQLLFVVQLAGLKEIIGVVIMKNIDRSVPKCELAYFVDATHEGRGIGTDAVKQALEYAFAALEIKKVSIKCDPENEASKNVAVKNGFEKEGYLKKEFRTGEGELIDLESYGLLNHFLP